MNRNRLALIALAVLLLVLPAHGQQIGGDGKVLVRWLGYNVAAPGANTNIITKDMVGTTITSLRALGPASKMRVTVSLATTSVFDIRVTDGTTAFTIQLNSGTALTAGQAYTFEWGVTNLPPCQTQTGTPAPLLWNFRVETNSVIQMLEVDEVSAAS